MLPGIDDGPATPEESAELLAALAADGVDVVAATPHLRSDFPAVRPAELRGRIADLRAALAGQPGPVVMPAGEVSLPWAIAASDEDLLLVTFGQNGRYVLIETPYGPANTRFEEALMNLRLRGVRIVLAHPERNRTYQDAPQRLGALIGRGVLVQINASSLLSTKRGSRSRQLARALLREGAAHVIASDAHSAAWRPPRLTEAVAAARAIAGPRADWMVQDAPEAILAGADLPPAPAGRRSLGLRRRRDKLRRP